MTDGGFFRSDEPVPDVAVGCLPRSAPDGPWRTNVHQEPVIGGGDGGAHVTARDAARFMSALDDGTLPGPRRRRRVSDDTDLVVLCSMEGLSGEVLEAVLESLVA